jgi:putative transposase
VRGWLQHQQVQTLYIDPGCPWQNGYEERFNGAVRDECLNSQAFVSVAEAQVLCATYLREYNEARPHSSVGYQTSLEFKHEWYARQSPEAGL